MEILFYWALSSLILILLVVGIESLIIPRLSYSSKFNTWWRSHVIEYYDESKEI